MCVRASACVCICPYGCLDECACVCACVCICLYGCLGECVCVSVWVPGWGSSISPRPRPHRTGHFLRQDLPLCLQNCPWGYPSARCVSFRLLTSSLLSLSDTSLSRSGAGVCSSLRNVLFSVRSGPLLHEKPMLLWGSPGL